MNFHVYRAYNRQGVLLYVGQSIDIEGRMRTHARTSPLWWRDAARVTFEPFATREEAVAAEAAAIRSEFPRWNVMHRSPNHPDGRAVMVVDVVHRFHQSA
jgi:excinuclease UvrABC nuclease subunit